MLFALMQILAIAFETKQPAPCSVIVLKVSNHAGKCAPCHHLQTSLPASRRASHPLRQPQLERVFLYPHRSQHERHCKQTTRRGQASGRPN